MKVKACCLFLGMWLSAGMARADASLFFTPAESRAIRALQAKMPVQDSGDIHLGAVFYYGEDNWVLWLQGARRTPETDRDDVRIVAVSPDAVRLRVNLAAGVPPQMVTLKPHQTYRLATGEVVEGSSVSSVVESSSDDDVSR